MPTYNFQCNACQAQFEQFQTFKEYDDNKAVACCKCKSVDTMRQITNTMFVFDSTPKTVGSLADKNWKMMGTAARDKAKRQHAEDKKRARKMISPNAKEVVEPKDYKTYWPKLSKEALSKIDVKDYILSDSPPKAL